VQFLLDVFPARLMIDGKQQLYVTFLDHSCCLTLVEVAFQHLETVTLAWIIDSGLVTFMSPCQLSF